MPNIAEDYYLATTDLDELIAGIAAGNRQAFARLYELTRVSVYSFALSIVKNPMDAEDVLQDCYVNIYSGAAGYQSKDKPMAWILTITKNLCYKRLRDQSRTEALRFEDLLPSSGNLSMEDKLLLSGCMSILSDEERQIVILHAVAGFMHWQIAKFLGLKLSTVLSKYRRAIKKLKASL